MSDNKGLISREELNEMMARDAGEQAAQVSISDKQMVYLVQSTTPEFEQGKAKRGDFLLRSADKNFGNSFTAIIIGYDAFYIKWEGPVGKGRIVYSILEELLPNAPAAIQAETRWGDNDEPPAAQHTWQFALLHAEKGQLDPNNYGVFYAGLAMTAEKHGKELAKVLKRKATREGKPSYRLVVRFNSIDETSEAGKEYKSWEANIVQELDPENPKHLEILSATAHEAQIYQKARKQALDRFASIAPTLSQGKREAVELDAQVDKDAEAALPKATPMQPIKEGVADEYEGWKDEKRPTLDELRKKATRPDVIYKDPVPANGNAANVAKGAQAKDESELLF